MIIIITQIILSTFHFSSTFLHICQFALPISSLSFFLAKIPNTLAIGARHMFSFFNFSTEIYELELEWHEFDLVFEKKNEIILINMNDIRRMSL